MATTNANFRVDTQAKDQFEAIVNQLGMTASTAYNLFINATIQRRALPFDVTLDPLTIPEVRAKVEAELERRLARENDPTTKWYSGDQVREMLGLNK
ncbi:MAG: type II toxin-antitoxin system RelB/DinJ family antitoxin [Clostridia bacterium]|nr:type II toxin-antitoxin system RelB/DinJ family antitoxin [Clostridia bacterium]